jgi:glycosyltransferase involved in cell wall biosynthesis
MKPATGDRPRVLLVDLSRHYGGADRRVHQTATALADRCDIAVAVLGGSVVERELRAAGVEVFSVHRRRHDPRIIGDLKRIAGTVRPHVIDAHNPQSQLWGLLAARAAGVKARLMTVHSVYRTAHRGVVRQRSHEAVLVLARTLGAEFLAVSRSVRDYLAHLGVDRSRIHLVPNGIEPLEGGVQPAGLRTQLALGAGDVLIGIIGRIEEVKGHDVLVDAVLRLRDRGRIVHVAVVGDGPDAGRLRAQVSRHGLQSQIHMIGFRRDIPGILADLDALCMPSRSEGLPYTILEAARQGVPIVASSATGLAAVLENGTTALLAPPGNADLLASAIETVVLDADLRLRLGRAGRDMVEREFSLARMAGGTLDVYRALSARTAAPT